MTCAQAEWLVANPLLMPLYRSIESARKVGSGGVATLDAGFVCVVRGTTPANFRPQLFIGEALSIDVALAGGHRATFTREDIRRRAADVQDITWPDDTVVGIVCTDELRSWRVDHAIVAPYRVRPRAMKIGPAGVARRRDALWSQLGEEDRRSTWTLVGLEALADADLARIDGLIVPGGRLWASRFNVPADPTREEASRTTFAENLRRLDDALSTDRASPLRTVALDSAPEARATPAAPEVEEGDGVAEAAALASLAKVLPRRERQLLHLLLQGHDYTSAARKLKVQPGAARAMGSRILSRARSLKPKR
jgi:hypothetical protein